MVKIVYYSGVSIQKEKDGYQVSFSNYPNGSVKGLKIVAHYEGGLGKPRPRHVTIKGFKRLAKGKKVSVHVRKFLKPGTGGKTRGAFRLFSVIISGQFTYRDRFHFDCPIWRFVKPNQ
ncbi:MAG: hypothetical protein IEMM0008_0157 [bacterium]|nr:MAG: hypothetical protein IEMM0008_0157 [bacterium]